MGRGAVSDHFVFGGAIGHVRAVSRAARDHESAFPLDVGIAVSCGPSSVRSSPPLNVVWLKD